MGELEAKRREDLENLKSLLKMRINQQKMLNDTLCEMMTKNSDRKSIEMIKEELNEIMDDISNINLDIEKLNEKDEEITYSFYDNVENIKPKTRLVQNSNKVRKKQMENNKTFYDSIVKQKKANVNDELNENLVNVIDLRLQSNRFIVDLKESLGIPENMIKSVSFCMNDSVVSVCIYDFVTNFNIMTYPIMQALKYTPDSFNFSIKHLDKDGNVAYIEKYYNCHLGDIYRDPIDCDVDDFSKIQLFIRYQNVEYETSN